MRPASVGVQAHVPHAPSGRDRDGAERDQAFGTILSDVAQDKSAGAPATESGTVAISAGKRATMVAARSDVGAWLVHVEAAAPAASPTVAGKAKSEAASTAADDVSSPSKDGPTATADASLPGAAVAAASIAAAALAVRTVPFAGATINEPAPMRATGSAHAIETNAKPIASAAETETDVLEPAVASTQVALIEIASHLAPSRSPQTTPRDVAAAKQEAAGDDVTHADTAASTEPTDAASAEPVQPSSDDKRPDPPAAITGPSLAASAQLAEAAVGNHPVQQIADAVNALAAEISGAGADPGAAAPKALPARSLTLQLAPTSLGQITVRLHLGGQGLSVRLAVENQSTLGLISHSRDALEAAIGAGCRLDSLVIQSADATAPQAGSHDTTRPDGGTLADQRSGSGSSGGEGAAQRRPRPTPHEARVSNDRGADGLFI